MTDKQLAILMNQYAKRLRAGLAYAMENLPAEALATGKSFLGQEFVYAPALSDLEDLASEIEKSAEILESTTKT